MPRNKPDVELYSYGIYTKWNKLSKQLPKLKEITTQIPVNPEVEFGYVLKIKKAKGEILEYEIHHPPFKDQDGKIVPPFTGEVLINSNDWEFFLGDTVWEPYDDKAGEWILVTRLQNKEIARKKFILFLP
ncbi:DUF3859 domain-containing protein [Thermophagus sp. OGC60D27]|uniref:DUF3859 domain-containing protein n=1 Tax=Thermophagus sp. OGC60D27 TaxID=3458415 RepID=UPI004037F912